MKIYNIKNFQLDYEQGKHNYESITEYMYDLLKSRISNDDTEYLFELYKIAKKEADDIIYSHSINETFSDILTLIIENDLLDLFELAIKNKIIYLDEMYGLSLIYNSDKLFSFQTVLFENDISISYFIKNYTRFIYACENYPDKMQNIEILNKNLELSGKHITFYTTFFNIKSENIKENSFFYNDSLFVSCINKPMSFVYLGNETYPSWKNTLYKETTL